MHHKISKRLCLIVLATMIGCSGSDTGKDSVADSSDSSENQSNTPDRPSRNSSDRGPNTRKSTKQDGPPIKSSKTSLADQEDSVKMKKVALALHTFMAKNKRFPFVVPPDANPKRNSELSWRVELLETLGQKALFGKFKLSDGPDTPENMASAESGKDIYSLSNGALISGITTEKPVSHFRDLMDGSSNTIMLIENPNLPPSEWSKSNDITVEDGVKLLKSIQPGEFLRVCLYDARVISIGCLTEKNLSDEQISWLFKPNDGNPIPTGIFR